MFGFAFEEEVRIYWWINPKARRWSREGKGMVGDKQLG